MRHKILARLTIGTTVRALALRGLRAVWPERDPRRGRPIVRIHIRTSPAIGAR